MLFQHQQVHINKYAFRQAPVRAALGIHTPAACAADWDTAPMTTNSCSANNRAL